MSRRIRIMMGILILVMSMALLYWGFAPARRETRIQTISPAEMQLPTPSSLQLDLDSWANASRTQPVLAL